MSRIKIKQIQGLDTLSFYVKSSGNTITNVINALYTNTISATTYQNLPLDITVTGGTYTTGTATFTNNTGGTFTVTGFSTGGGSTFTGGTVTGPTNFTDGLSANTISATTYYNLPIDIRVTGGTYSNGTTTFTNNTGGTFSVSGFSTGTSSTDTFVTGATYSNNTFAFTNNTGGTFNVLFNTVTGLTVNGDLTVTGGTQSIFSGNSSSDLVRITQTGSGNAFVVEDDSNSDSTPFVIDANGNVGMGTLTPQTVLHVKSNPSSTQTAIIRLESAAQTANSSIAYWSAGVNRWEVGTGIALGLPYEIYDRVAGETRFAITTGGATAFLNGNVGIGTSTPITKLDVNGDTRISGGLTANTISATTYFNLPTDVRVTGGTYTSGTATFTNNTGGTFSVSGFSTGSTTNIGSGTINYLPKWTGSTALGNSLIRDDGTNIGINTAPSSEGKVYIYSNTGNTSALYVQNQSTASSYGIWSFVNSGMGSQTAILGIAEGNPITGTSIGLLGFANDGLLGIGVKGAVGTTEFGTMTTGIGGSFDGRGDGGYGYPSISYSVQLLDGTEGINKVLVSKTADGKANWSSILSGLTGVYTNTISATTYFNLPTDVRVTGGTYSNGTTTFTNNTGGTFTVTGFSTGGTSSTDTFVTGATYSNNTFTFRNNTGGTFNVLFNTVTGLTSTGTIASSVLSATTYQNLPTDIRVTGGTLSSGTATFTNNTGGTFTVTGFSTGGGTFTGGTVSGATYFTGGVSANTLTASGTGQNILTVIGSGNSTSSPIFSVIGSQGELFSVSDSLTGSLFSVNDISGLPIVEVFSDNTILMGSYQAPSLNTTVKVTLTAGTNTVYSIPTSGYTGAFFDYAVISTGSTGARAGTIMSIWSGTTAQSTDVSTNDIGTTAGISFSVAVVGSNAVLSSSATTAGWTLKTIVRSI